MITRIISSVIDSPKVENNDTNGTIKYEVIRSLIEDTKQAVVLDFSASWCGPCKKLYPVIKALAEKYNHIHFFKIDICQQDEENLGDLYNISSLPTCLFFNNGELLQKEEGLQSGASNIINALSKLICDCDSNKNNNDVINEINNYLIESCQSRTQH
jgi:thioredoxin